MIEKTLVLVKPDGVRRGLIGEIIKRFEQRGLRIIGMKMIHVDKEFAKKHYTEDISIRHGEKIRSMLLDFITEGPIISMCIEGINAVENVRKICGNTYPHEAAVGTIRGDFAHISKEHAINENIQVRNVVHSSGSKEEAISEVNLWFSSNELYNYKTNNHHEIF